MNNLIHYLELVDNTKTFISLRTNFIKNLRLILFYIKLFIFFNVFYKYVINSDLLFLFNNL